MCNIKRGQLLNRSDKVTMTTIQMLQTELDPHMLYNSLESAYSIAKINKQEEIAQLVMALSKFFPDRSIRRKADRNLQRSV